jgi:drug/metabolite transporter (DMT)-like permease
MSKPFLAQYLHLVTITFQLSVLFNTPTFKSILDAFLYFRYTETITGETVYSKGNKGCLNTKKAQDTMRLKQWWNNHASQVKIHGLLLSMTVIYGIFFPVLKLFCNELQGIEVAVLRQLGFALVVILFGWLWDAWPRLPCWQARFKQDWGYFVLAGVLGVFWLQTFSSIAIGYTTSFHATLCMASVPLQTMMINAVLGVERLNAQKTFGVALGTLGIIGLVVAQMQDASSKGLIIKGSNLLLGDGLILLNAFFFSWYNIVVKKLMKHYTPLDVLSWNFLQAGTMTLFFMLLPPIPFLHFPSVVKTLELFKHLTPSQWGYWLYIVLIAGFLGYWVHHKGLSKTSANNVAAYGMLQPVIAAILGAWWLQESFTLSMGVAGVITLTGLSIANFKSGEPLGITAD